MRCTHGWLWLAGLTIMPCGAAAEQAEPITVIATGTAVPPGAGLGTVRLGRSDIEASGVQDLGALLEQLPAAGAQGIGDAQNDGGFGEHFIDLRNLNFDRTLVLVDGRRFVPSGIQTDEAVDLNGLPLGFIDHVEVLTDGTQPRYAADAVAGVVNVVLKDQIKGLHLQTYGAAAGAGGDGTAEVSLTGGRAVPGGHLAFGLDAYSRAPVWQASRPWAALPVAEADASGTIYGTPATLGGHAVADGVNAVALPGGRTRPYDPADNFNTATGRSLEGRLRRATAYLDADMAVTSQVSADLELLYTQRSATNNDPPPILGLTGTARHPDGFTVPAADPFNPFGVPVTLERVVGEAGGQVTTTSGPVWRVLAGLEGTWRSWNWSVSYDHGQSQNTYDTTNQIDLTRALAGVSGQCSSAEGCVAADWFGPGSLSPAALQYVQYRSRSRSNYAEEVGQANLGGPLFTAPGGPAQLALGLEARHEHGSTSVDPVTARGDQADEDAAPTSGGYDTAEAYATVDLPLARRRAWASMLDVSLAARGTLTSRYGSYPSVRATMEYAPVEGLRLRAVSGIARRPPAISEAFGGITAAPQTVTDPCDARSGLRAIPVVEANCLSQGLETGFAQASPLIEVESGGNAHLRPERSQNETIGIEIDPPGLKSTKFSIDYYRYEIHDAIDSLADSDPDHIADACYETAALASPLCGLVTRLSGGGNTGQINSILGLDENVGTIKTHGLDFGLTLRDTLSPRDAVSFEGQATWLLDWRLHDLGSPGYTQYAGTLPGLMAVGSYARVRARATAEWTHGPWVVGWTGRFLSGARVLEAAAGDRHTAAPDVLYQDLQLTRTLGRWRLIAGIDNLADTPPPTLVDGLTNTDTNSYDVLGRVVWVRVGIDL